MERVINRITELIAILNEAANRNCYTEETKTKISNCIMHLTGFSQALQLIVKEDMAGIHNYILNYAEEVIKLLDKENKK